MVVALAPALAIAAALGMAAGQGVTVGRAFTLQDARIGESSGLATSSYAQTSLITHNDSGGKPEYFVVDARTGSTLRRVPVPGATNVDWEDIAVAGRTVYLADIGDNRAARTSVTIYAVDEARQERDPPTATKTVLTYDDGPRDAEALLVSPDGRTRYVVSKQILGARVYLVDGSRLRPVGNLGAGLVTGGSWSPDGSRIALVTYGSIYVYDAAAFPTGAPERLDLPPLDQAESIAWNGDDALLVGSEGKRAPVYRLDLPPRVATASATPGTASGKPAPSTTAKPSGSATATATAPAATPTANGAPTGGSGRGWTKALAVGAVILVFGGIAQARARRRRNGGVG